MTICDDNPDYTIVLDSNNNVIVKGNDGKVIDPVSVTFPICLGDNSQLVSAVSLNILEVKGSHYILREQDGSWVRYDLPAPHP